jgi:flagellin-like protein
MMNKKAVSPLIATVLLIAFAVALGAIVMNWGSGYVKSMQDYSKENSESMVRCSANVNLELEITKAIVDLDGTTPSRLNNLSISLDNKGGQNVPQFIIKLYDEKAGEGVSILYNATEFSRYSARKFDFTNTSQFYLTNTTTYLKNVTQITVIPFIKVPGVTDLVGCESRETVVAANDDDSVISYT